MTENPLAFDRGELEQFVEEYMKLDRRVQRPKGIYSILRGPRERKYQYTLKYFLDPRKSHGFGYTLLTQFLDCLDVHEFNLSRQHIEIEDEVQIADEGADGRIDLVICGGNALEDYPRWAVFLELKVGAEEGEQQTTTYATADAWQFNWFDSNKVAVEELNDAKYVYVKRDVAEPPKDETGTFESYTWSDLVESFEEGIQDSLFEYPNRSVIQFTDFIQSLKETEDMDSPIEEDELNERLHLYFEHSDLIQQIERANSQFESDFEDVSTYLKDNWVNKLNKKYDFVASGWKTSSASDPKWQKILPAYWDQDPLDSRSTIQLYYRHSPTTTHLRDQILSFRLRLPPKRNVHTAKRHAGQSFNDIFTEKCTAEYAESIQRSLEEIDVDELRLGSASALVVKNYQLDPHNLTESYFEQLDTAVSDFCTDRSEFSRLINGVFEETYREVFGKRPTGEFPGELRER
ncbi:PD-(D/E)XK nuclease family protein [Natrialbaceae archaeon GCM10025810]|uniref:PD-(D/E)XK nuclease family protein n=1 Tax=Halovalidus salilacus TaxID=3075124 RepID=UPI00362289D0